MRCKIGTLSRTGKSKQLVYDAVKKARNTGEPQWVNYKGQRIKVHDPDVMIGVYGHSGLALVKHRGRLILTEVSSKDSYSWINFGYLGTRYIQPKDVAAFVSEVHDR